MTDPDTTDVTDLTCPTCGAPVAAGDAFCEACGAQLSTESAAAAETAPEDADNTGDTERGPRTVVASAACAFCGGRVLDDGFCGTCGQKARSPRDHWSENPSPWVAGVCDKG